VPGAPSETLLFGDPATCSRLLVVFPGNPGAPLFYLDVCAHIFRCAAPGGGLAVAVVGYAGHSAGSHGLLPAVHGLQAQVAHGIAAARALAAASPRGCRLLLAGHSIGAHVALAAARAGLPRAVARTVLWFPTIHHIGRSPNGVALLPLMKYGRGVLAAVWLRWLIRSHVLANLLRLGVYGAMLSAASVLAFHGGPLSSACDVATVTAVG
jgi:alpha-beta hydrolase superfamily lysophospholipase